MQFAETADGARLAWEVQGSGAPLLLIAGQATGMAGWDPIMPALTSSFRVIRFDHRGVGSSSEAPDPISSGPTTTREFGSDVLAVMDAAGAERAHIYGHSMGGRVAQWLAIDHPERVGALILAGTSAGGFLGSSRDPKVTDALTSGDPARLEPLFFDPGWAAAHPDAVRAFFTARASREAKRRQFRASAAHDARDALSAISAPTLILHGAEDILTPLENASVLRAMIPRSVLAKVPGGRHGFHLDHPETVDWIKRFIAQRVPGS